MKHADKVMDIDARCVNRWCSSIYLFSQRQSVHSTTVYNNLARRILYVAVTDANGSSSNAPAATTIIRGATAIAVTKQMQHAAVMARSLLAGYSGLAPYTYSSTACPFTATTVYNNLPAGAYTKR